MSSLPHKFYFSDEILRLEREVFCFQDNFFGHRSFVNGHQNYYALPHTNEARLLIQNGDNIRVLHNICKHRYATLLKGRGNCHNIVCPVHSWSYDKTGKILSSAPIECDSVTHSLDESLINIYDGFIFSKHFSALRDALSISKTFTRISFRDLSLLGHETFSVGVNWKTYIDTFLDNYHLETFHPSFKAFLDPNQIELSFQDEFQLQAVVLKDKFQPMTPTLQAYLDSYNQHVGGLSNHYAAVWLCVYPNIIIEIYQCFLLIAIVIPQEPEICLIHEYHFIEQDFSQHQDLLAAFERYMAEIEQQDHDLMARIHQGRKALYAQGDEHCGPYHPTKEIGQQHFHHYLSRMLYSENA